jgi:hypothetical protein
MKYILATILFLLLSNTEPIYAQSFKSFKIENGDTINCIDSNNYRQGKWVERRGMVFFVGNYINNLREGVWIFYGVGEKPITFE